MVFSTSKIFPDGKVRHVSVSKHTDVDLMRSSCEMTFNGKSKQSLLSMYVSEHSPTRTQMFWLELKNIPLYVSTHLLRHHVGSQPFALTHRNDRMGGGYDLPTLVNEIKGMMDNVESDSDYEAVKDKLDFISDNCGRNTPTDLGLWINAQSLIDMAKSRICLMASKETRDIFDMVKSTIIEVDPDLAKMLVPKCVYRNGLCGEGKNCCGLNKRIESSEFAYYKELFS